MGSIITDEEQFTDDLLRRRRTFATRRSLSEYAVSLPSPPVEAPIVNDDTFRFFKRGREYQPRKAHHHFTAEELRVLETYESAGIFPSHSQVYRKWLEGEERNALETWTILIVVSLLTGSFAFILRLICEQVQLVKLIPNSNDGSFYFYYTFLSALFAALSAFIIIYICPTATGSGLPEIIGILNGVVVRNVLSFRTLVCKILSVIFVVVSKLPCGFEGPMIHIGAMLGAVGARPCKFGCLSKLCRYRDCQERYSLICVGAASGVASAFSSPISGLIFAMEEISSHWSRKQTWRTFVCCIVARGISELLRSLFLIVKQHGQGELTLSEKALFEMDSSRSSISLMVFLPACVLGCLGGVLGGMFIFINLKAAKFRRRLFGLIQKEWIQNLGKMFEVVIIALMCSAISLTLLSLSECKNFNGKLDLNKFNCTNTNGGNSFNEIGSLFIDPWEKVIRNLFSRKTVGLFTIQPLGTCLAFFWIFSCWISMASVAAGILIPQLAIGSLLGRILGEWMHLQLNPENISDWMDPGVFALLGAASFLSGTSRLPITSVVMMVELTNDVTLALLIMMCVMISKFVGDLMTHSIYHSVLEVKCIPVLDPDLTVYFEGKKVHLELFTASTVMVHNVLIVNVKESVKVLANLLLDTNHGAFPVVSDDGNQTYLGVITRLELTILLTKTERFDPREIEKDDMDRLRISYPEYSSTKLKNTANANHILNKYSVNIIYKNIYVNLLPYINVSAPSVPPNFCLRRTYAMFTAMGLRHLIVTGRTGRVGGIITRKDLLGFSIEQKIQAALLLNKSFSVESKGSVSSDCSIEVKSTIPLLKEVDEESA